MHRAAQHRRAAKTGRSQLQGSIQYCANTYKYNLSADKYNMNTYKYNMNTHKYNMNTRKYYTVLRQILKSCWEEEDAWVDYQVILNPCLLPPDHKSFSFTSTKYNLKTYKCENSIFWKWNLKIHIFWHKGLCSWKGNVSSLHHICLNCTMHCNVKQPVLFCLKVGVSSSPFHSWCG